MAELVYDRLEAGGGLVLIAGGAIWNGKQEWEKVVVATIQKWLGPERRAGGGVFEQGELHQEVLKRTRFDSITTFDVAAEYDWTIEDILGYLYSTSFSSKRVLGDRIDAFEKDLRQALAALSEGAAFKQRIEFTAISTRKPKA